MIDPQAMNSGFWGPATSSVDWCEANYRVTPYVAEFWNTFSSLAMVIAGLAGVLRYRRELPRRFIAAYALLALVGVGSVAFHATLRFELQMLDELPMLYLVLLIVDILAEPGPVRRHGQWLPWLLAGYGLFLTILCVASRGALEFWIFQLSFGSLELWSLWQAFRLYRRSVDPRRRRLFRSGMAAYLLGIVVWFADLRFCPVFGEWMPAHDLPNPQLHAWWHALVAVGFYLLLRFIGGETRAAWPRSDSGGRAGATTATAP